ncbi:MAG: nucleotidyltransferase family protein, partial [Clostridia bacterium]|nr:nucleotidyltransferase family protein [Clostridia bacterium]
MTETKALFSILSNVVFNAEDVIDSKDLSEDLIKKLYTLSNKYDLCPLVSHYLLKKEGVNQNLLEPFSAMLFGSLARHENRICEYEQVASVFTDAKIPFMPVKGILIYDLYPEPYLRTS